jgi:hypothetical protein
MPVIKQPTIHTRISVHFRNGVSRFTVPRECSDFGDPNGEAIIGIRDAEGRTHAINLSHVQEVIFEPFVVEEKSDGVSDPRT